MLLRCLSGEMILFLSVYGLERRYRFLLSTFQLLLYNFVKNDVFRWILSDKFSLKMLQKFSNFWKFPKFSELGLSWANRLGLEKYCFSVQAYKMTLMRPFHRFGIREEFYSLAVKLFRTNSEHMVTVKI